MREIRLSGSEGGGANPIVSPYPYLQNHLDVFHSRERETPRHKAVASVCKTLQSSDPNVSQPSPAAAML